MKTIEESRAAAERAMPTPAEIQRIMDRAARVADRTRLPIGEVLISETARTVLAKLRDEVLCPTCGGYGYVNTRPVP